MSSTDDAQRVRRFYDEVIAPAADESLPPTSYYRPGDIANIRMMRGGVITGRVTTTAGQPIVGVRVRPHRVKDLKSRGLLDSTLVIWGGEFGRMPMSEGSNGRDHNPHGFSMWLAGGGVKGGQVIGGTDAVGLRAEHEKAHVHDIHATILHLLGLDHTRLTFRHNGRNERLTDVSGNVIPKMIA